MKKLIFVKPCHKCEVGYTTDRKFCDYCKEKLPAKLWFNSFEECDAYLEKNFMVERAN